jgi:hypothetical protein
MALWKSASSVGLTANIRMDGSVVELEAAIRAEGRARAALIAIGEEWKALHELGREPTEEEVALRTHLVQVWEKSARRVTDLLERPLR